MVVGMGSRAGSRGSFFSLDRNIFSRFTGKLAAFSFQTSFRGIPWVRKETQKGKLLFETQFLTIILDHLRYQRSSFFGEVKKRELQPELAAVKSYEISDSGSAILNLYGKIASFNCSFPKGGQNH